MLIILFMGGRDGKQNREATAASIFKIEENKDRRIVNRSVMAVESGSRPGVKDRGCPPIMPARASASRKRPRVKDRVMGKLLIYIFGPFTMA
jgi:hypothetical protein